jgi:hypothetical protein
MTQTRLTPLTPKYSLGPYNKEDKEEQWIRITEGCPHNCAWCYEPEQIKIFGIPEITRNKVKILDMNLLCKKEAFSIIQELGTKKVMGKSVYYELICGIDYRFLNGPIANALYANRFKKIRLAWDGPKQQQKAVKHAINHLTRAGYNPSDLSVFIICNHESSSHEDNRFKLDLCKVWNVKVNDCYYDNQTSPNIIPLAWTDSQIKDFRHRCRKHNQYVLFRIDPQR